MTRSILERQKIEVKKTSIKNNKPEKQHLRFFVSDYFFSKKIIGVAIFLPNKQQACLIKNN